MGRTSEVIASMLKEASADSTPSERRGFLLPEISPRERTCRRCGFEGEETLFKFSGKKGNRGNICRKCDAERSRKRQAEHGIEINAHRRERRARNPERFRARERASRLARIDRVRAQNIEAVKRYRRNHPEKVAAHKIAQRALKRGEIVKPTTCQAKGCACREKLSAHHADYSKPLRVAWLCIEHHEATHHRGPVRLKASANGLKFACAPKDPATNALRPIAA